MRTWTATTTRRTALPSGGIETGVAFVVAPVDPDNFTQSIVTSGDFTELARLANARIAAIQDSLATLDGVNVLKLITVAPPGLLTLINATPSAQTPYQAGDYVSCAAALNTKSQSVKQPTPFSTADIIGCLDVPAMQKLDQHPSLARMLDAIDRQDRDQVGKWAAWHVTVANISSAQQTAITAVLTATQAIAASPAEVQYGLGTIITADQVRVA